MRKQILKISAIVVLFASLTAFQSAEQDLSAPFTTTPPSDARSPEMCIADNNAFQVGEELTYIIYYNWKFVWMAAGEVTFKVEDQGDQYYLSAKGKTYKEYEWFYKVNDVYETYVDKSTLLPNRSIRNIQEGKYRLYDEITFDQGNKTCTSMRGKSKDIAEPTQYELGSCMHDLLSIIYYCRNIDYNSIHSQSTIPIKIFMDKEVWPLGITYKGKEERKKIKGIGRYNTIQFGPEVIEGYIFNKDANMNVWVSDDQNKIPLLIESPLSVGTVKVVLKKHQGLRHPLSSKTKKKKA